MKKMKFILGHLLYKFAPIKHNRYVFTSFNGHYSDNTKAISCKLHELDESSEIIWLVDPIYKELVPAYAKSIDINSLKAYWYRGSAMTQVDNVYGFRALFLMNDDFVSRFKFHVLTFLTKKKKQPVFATMHGTPLKRIGCDQVGNTVLDMSCYNSYLLVGDALTSDVLKRVTFGRMHIEILGSARNDVLYLNSKENKKKIGLPEDKKIILFAPTFRNDGKDVDGKNVYRSGLNQLGSMDFELLFKTLTHKFGGEWIMVCRFHYHVANMVDWNALNETYPSKFINGNLHDDMADYLACTDMLLTDSSSSMFDFCKTKKPCLLFFPDIENYRNKERGFYLNIEELPFPLAVEFSALVNNIEKFDQAKYSKEIDLLVEKIGSRDDGNSAERIVRYIIDKCSV